MRNLILLCKLYIIYSLASNWQHILFDQCFLVFFYFSKFCLCNSYSTFGFVSVCALKMSRIGTNFKLTGECLLLLALADRLWRVQPWLLIFCNAFFFFYVRWMRLRLFKAKVLKKQTLSKLNAVAGTLLTDNNSPAEDLCIFSLEVVIKLNSSDQWNELVKLQT